MNIIARLRDLLKPKMLHPGGKVIPPDPFAPGGDFIQNPDGSYTRKKAPAPVASPAASPVVSPIPLSAQYDPQVGPPRSYRNPLWDQWKKQNPKGFETLMSATAKAAKQYDIPQSLLMDIAGIETSGGQNLTQENVKDPRKQGRGYYQFDRNTLEGLGVPNLDPYDAVATSELVARLIKNKALSRWGYDENKQVRMDQYKLWGSVDNPNNKNGRLSDYYSKEEINRFLQDQYHLE